MEENRKKAGFFANFQTAAYSGFAYETEIKFIDKTDFSNTNRREHFCLIDTVKTCYQGLNNIDPYH